MLDTWKEVRGTSGREYRLEYWKEALCWVMSGRGHSAGWGLLEDGILLRGHLQGPLCYRVSCFLPFFHLLFYSGCVAAGLPPFFKIIYVLFVYCNRFYLLLLQNKNVLWISFFLFF